MPIPPYSTPEDVRTLYQGSLDTLVPTGTPDADAFFVSRIAYADRRIDAYLRDAGVSVPVDVSEVGSAKQVMMRRFSVTGAVWFSQLDTNTVTEGVKMSWEDFLDWLKSGAHFGPEGSARSLVRIVAEPSVPSVPRRTWAELGAT